MKRVADGEGSAAVALTLGEDPTRFLSTVQIGITCIGILSGIVGESVLADPLSLALQHLGMTAKVADLGSTAFVVILITYFSIVVGELVPKRIGQAHPEAIACLVARPMQVLALIARPFVVLLSVSTHTMLRALGVSHANNGGVTEEEIHAMLKEGSDSGLIELQQHTMVRNVFRLDDRQLGTLMVPRPDIVYIDLELPPEENLRVLIESGHSRFPVCRGGLDELVGVLHARQVLAAVASGKQPDFESNLQPCIFVPETLTGMELLEQFRARNMPIAFVIDEYGEVEGIVTLRDMLEAVTGEFSPRNADDVWATQREDGSWLLDGLIPIPELKDRLELEELPEEGRDRYNTLSGMIMLLLGRVPATGDRADWGGWRFEVVDMDEQRVDKVLATSLRNIDAPAPPGGEAGPPA
jgi:putative hemolysin